MSKIGIVIDLDQVSFNAGNIYLTGKLKDH